MKCNVSIPERMKDLRVERHLSLEELEAAVGISKSALGSYESTEGCKEINHGSILKLADFYQVSTDYLLCRTDNRNPENIELTELHINDEVVELLKSERFNNRLLCEIISHEKFRELLPPRIRNRSHRPVLPDPQKPFPVPAHFHLYP